MFAKGSCGIVLALSLVACGPAVTPLPRPTASPLWLDDDRHPFAPAPSDDGTGLVWDGVDQTLLRPATRFLAVDVAGEAANVNAADEVPSSSWFTNRAGLFPLDPEELAAGPCTNPPLDVTAPITIVQSKLDGASPGFVVRGTNGLRYMMKLDGPEQAPRPTAADVIASKILYGAGFTTPCNRIVFFDRAVFRIDKKATARTWTGGKEPFTNAHLDLALTYAARLEDGRYRASVSEWLEGKPIGPWRYHGVRDDDPNDVVAHEDRRELRGLRLLAAWLGHSDARSRNTLDVWIPTGNGTGWIRHDLVDFSDCFGSAWEPPEMGRRFGHSYWFDVGDIAGDFVSLGAIARPWDRERLGCTGKVFGYYDVDSFDPERWVMEYPNPAFSRMTERDGAWMARIIADFTDEHLRRVIRTGRLGAPALESELLRVLTGRRDKILRRYLLARISALGLPLLSTHAHGDVAVCARDLAVVTGLVEPRAHTATISTRPGATTHVRTEKNGQNVCVDLGRAEVALSPSIAITTVGARSGPLVVRVAVDAAERPILVRVERPYGP